MPLVIPTQAPPFVKVGQTNTYTTGSQDLTSATSLIVPASAAYAPTADASLGYDTTADSWVGGGGGAVTGRVHRTLSSQLGSSDTLSAATITTNETNFATNFVIPANYFTTNRTIRVMAAFEETTSGSPPTQIFRLKLGTVAIATSGTATPTNSRTGIGTSVAWIVQGTAAAGASVNVETGMMAGAFLVFGAAAPSANVTSQPIAIATNAPQTLQISLQFSANTAGNSVTLRQLQVEELY